MWLDQYNELCKKYDFAPLSECGSFDVFLDHLWHTSGGAGERDREAGPEEKLCIIDFHDFLTTVLPGVVIENNAVFKISVLRESYLIKPCYKALVKLTKAGAV